MMKRLTIAAVPRATLLSATGFGDTHAVASNDTPGGPAQNRRIEIVLEGPGA
jgi:flagellar motor protein MotB